MGLSGWNLNPGTVHDGPKRMEDREEVMGLKRGWRGLCVLYVDDLMLPSQRHIVEECLERVSREWGIRTPEWP